MKYLRIMGKKLRTELGKELEKKSGYLSPTKARDSAVHSFKSFKLKKQHTQQSLSNFKSSSSRHLVSSNYQERSHGSVRSLVKQKSISANSRSGRSSN